MYCHSMRSIHPSKDRNICLSVIFSSFDRPIRFERGIFDRSLNPPISISMLFFFSFFHLFPFSVLTKCQKIGEGVFGEVYLNETYVLKIIPIEGDVEINGAQQKRFDEILQEVIISQELSALRYAEKNRSAGFVEVLNVRLVEGRYPEHLLNLWDKYDTLQVSENDRPDVFGDDQLYVVFELANCGNDLEAHVFKNAEQSYSAFKQVRAISIRITSFNILHSCVSLNVFARSLCGLSFLVIMIFGSFGG